MPFFNFIKDDLAENYEIHAFTEDGILYASKLRGAGVKVWEKCFPGEIHCLIGLLPGDKTIIEYENFIKEALVANFGELRPNHYHMGLDCRTEQVENKLVLAAADGYVAKVKIEPFGFGRCIYVNHPNGLTTLYAHLNDFNPALEKYITQQQYNLESWKVFLDIPAGLFPVKKGQFIAYSGNTGGSQGPHVHFEIRDTKTDKVLNPLLFDFPISDNIPPDILRLAVYDRCISTFEQSPKFYPLKKINGVYTSIPTLILAKTDRVSFAITAYDRYTGSTNKNGIYQAVIYDNGQPVNGFQLDSIRYDETRYMNAHVDYKLRSTGGSWVQHLSRLPGYQQGVYKDISGDGVIDIEDGLVQLHNGHVPVQSMFPVRIKNTVTPRPDKMVMHRSWADKNEYAKAVPVKNGNENNWYEASFRAFGNFQLLEDVTPPTVTPVGFREGMNAAKLNRIAFVVKDNTKELMNFNAYLDGRWLRFSNDKGSTFIYKFDEHCPPGAHELKISLEDCVGNKTERTYHFTR